MRKTVEGEQRERALEAARVLINFTNSTIADVEAFADAITSSHRTLQQNVMRVFMACVHKWAADYDNGYFDARNEATCLLAHNIHKAVMDRDGLPFI